MAENIQQEITQLEKQLAEKRASLEQRSAETGQETPHEKEILRQVVGERIQQARRQEESGSRPQASGQDDQSSYNDPQLVNMVQEMVNLAFNKSIGDAVRSVVRSNNPALIDAFHDVLVDQLYDALLERKKLEEVK